jgi:hypothetical protein
VLEATKIYFLANKKEWLLSHLELPEAEFELTRADGLGSSENLDNFQVRLELCVVKAQSLQIVIYVAKHPE